MRHRELEMHDIRKIVHESGMVEKVDFRITDFLDRVDALVDERFYRRRRLTGEQLRSIYHECMDIISKDVVLLDAVFTEIPATRTRPKGEVYEMRFVSFMKMTRLGPQFEDLFQLFSFRLRLSRRDVELDFCGHPVAFSYHAGERLMERGPETNTAMKMIASELAAHLELIRHAERHAIAHTDGRMIIPFRDQSGALFGEFIDVGAQFNRSTRFRKRSVKEAVPTTSSERFFVAKTYVNRFLLEPVQRYSLHLLSLWRNEASEEYETANARRCWTEGEGLAVQGPCLDDPNIERMLGLAFENHDFRRGLGRGCPEEPLPEDPFLPMGSWKVSDDELGYRPSFAA